MNTTTSGNNAIDASKTNAKRTQWEMAVFHNRVECDIRSHYQLKREVGTDGKPKVEFELKPLYMIFEGMQPFIEARCDHERAACKERWNQNIIGTPQSEFVIDKRFFKGIKTQEWNKYMPDYLVCPIWYRLHEDQRKELQRRHPGWLFVTVGDSGHDHPISHTSQMISSFNMINRLPSGKYLDVHGNPASNAKWNRLNKNKKGKAFIDTAVNIEGTKDVIRQRTKWEGNKYHTAAMRDIGHHGREKQEGCLASKYDALLSVHTLYYYTMPELLDAIRATKRKIMYALVHKHTGLRGEINGGEQKWERGYDDQITQVNDKTGEKYKHKSIDMFFSRSSWGTHTREQLGMYHQHSEVGLTWTINQSSEDVYLITITSLSGSQLALDPEYSPNTDTPQKVSVKVNSSEYIMREGETTITMQKATLHFAVPKHMVPIHEKARAKMHGKKRDQNQLRSHCNTISLAMNSVSGQTVKCEAHELASVIMSSFLVDWQTSYDVPGIFSGYSGFTKANLRASLLTCAKMMNIKDAKHAVRLLLEEGADWCL